MKFEGALISEQGQKFAVVVAKPYILNSSEREQFRNSFIPVFGNIPIILMTQDSKGVPTYNGRKDIVKFLANRHIGQIPWKKYTLG